MKRIHFIISGVAVIVLLIIFFIIWFATGRSKVKAPGGTNESQRLGVSDIKVDRKSSKCEDFDISDEVIKSFPNLKKMEMGNKGSLADDFPATPAKTQLCGSLSQLNSTYFITTLSADEVVTYYKRELPGKGYEVINVSRADNGDQVIEFKNSKGIGSVYTFYDRTAFSISFTANQ